MPNDYSPFISTSMKLTAVLLLSVAVSACGSNSPSSNAAGGNSGDEKIYDANIRRTRFGIAHIKAADFGSLGYGNGYAFAQDNVCSLMEDLITIRGQRAEFFGRDADYTIFANGSTASSVDSDFFWRHLLTQEAIDNFRDKQPADLAAAITGYAAGFSRYVRELKAGLHNGRHLACRDQAWLQEISEDDLYRRFMRLAVLASSSVFVEGIATAQPPATSFGNPASVAGNIPDIGVLGKPNSTVASSKTTPEQQAALAEALSYFIEEKPAGSNMYAIAAGQTDNGQGLLFGNPHFPWFGTERLWVNHLTIEDGGEPSFNIFGASLYGAPAVLIGFNEHVTWSHTVSAAYRFTFYELNLDPSNPTNYLVDGTPTPMVATDISIQVLEDDGSTSTATRTLYKTRYGPMVNIAPGLLEWGTPSLKAFTLRDANFENDRLLKQFFEWNKARSLDEFINTQANVLGVPWVNTAATGPGGDAYYGDVTVIPNTPDAFVQSCQGVSNTLVQQLVPGLPVLDGSRTACDWLTDADAPAPGIFGPNNLPKLRRDDYVTNCNDSYWLSNPREPLTGFARIIGDEATTRSLRTRLCIVHQEERMDGSDGLGGTKWNVDKLQEVVLASRLHAADLGVDNVLNEICNMPTLAYDDDANPATPNATVNISAECSVLAVWDGTVNNDSVGGHIWREFFRNLSDVADADQWRTQFSDGPITAYTTPNNLNTTGDAVRAAFGVAVQTLQTNGIPANARLGDLQYSLDAAGNRIEIYGGISNTTGAFTVIGNTNATPLNTAEGYGGVSRGNSYIQTVTWNADGSPDGEGFITYSQSTDPASPHFSDITQRYSDKQWVEFPYTEAEIAASLISSIRIVEPRAD